MPFKPPTQPSCARCSKTVYPTEKLDCLDKVWHKGCFTCAICNTKLTMSTYKGFDKEAYCKTHYPTSKATAVVETPEGQRLKKQSERQSSVMYHKAYEEAKGTYTSVADDVATRTATQTQQIASKTSYDQRDREAPPAASGSVRGAPAAVKAARAADPEPEPEPEQNEPEPEPQHDEPAPKASSGGARYKALFDYDAADEDEVTFAEGDIIADVEVIDEGWMTGTVEKTGKRGMLPSNYVEAL